MHIFIHNLYWYWYRGDMYIYPRYHRIRQWWQIMFSMLLVIFDIIFHVAWWAIEVLLVQISADILWCNRFFLKTKNKGLNAYDPCSCKTNKWKTLKKKTHKKKKKRLPSNFLTLAKKILLCFFFIIIIVTYTLTFLMPTLIPPLYIMFVVLLLLMLWFI